MQCHWRARSACRPRSRRSRPTATARTRPTSRSVQWPSRPAPPGRPTGYLARWPRDRESPSVSRGTLLRGPDDDPASRPSWRQEEPTTAEAEPGRARPRSTRRFARARGRRGRAKPGRGGCPLTAFGHLPSTLVASAAGRAAEGPSTLGSPEPRGSRWRIGACKSQAVCGWGDYEICGRSHGAESCRGSVRGASGHSRSRSELRAEVQAWTSP